MASLLAAIILFAGALWSWHSGQDNSAPRLYWAGRAMVVAVGMLYRYLKFFRHYTVEVFVTYAELE
ncbi:MAG: hypothetical protein ACLQAT_27340 [Candidatus Binataceae bacterium]